MAITKIFPTLFAVAAILICLTSVVIISPAGAAEAVPATLSAEDQGDVKRIEAYLNDIKTLQAGFLQVASNGAVATGKLFMSRPGKMRFEYDPPAPILMIADGVFLIYIDKELEQVTHIWLNSTPVGVLVRENIALSGDITLTKFEKGPGVIRTTISDTKDPEEGSITLIFSDHPLALRKWIVTDAQGVKTTVSLTGLQNGGVLDPNLFVFRSIKESQ